MTSAKFNITVSRDQLKDGEDIEAYVTRQVALLASKLKGHKVKRRHAETLGEGNSAIVGEAIDAIYIVQGKTYHQRQAAFALAGPFKGGVLIFSLSQETAFSAEINAVWRDFLSGFTPRAVI